MCRLFSQENTSTVYYNYYYYYNYFTTKKNTVLLKGSRTNMFGLGRQPHSSPYIYPNISKLYVYRHTSIIVL